MKKRVLYLFLLFCFFSIHCYSQKNDSLLISYNNVLKKCSSDFIDSMVRYKTNEKILAIKIVEMDTTVQKLSFAITSIHLNNEFNYLDPSFYFKINEYFILIKKNKNGDFMQKILNLPKVNEETVKEIEKFLIIKNADQWIHEPSACRYYFSNDTIKSIFHYALPLPWQYQILH